ncbi:MAG: glycine cleavage system protein GcvH [Candidatus Poseidoniales archaeon]|jgi:glycine cleavage system H protein|nr:MAG: glycine cleavage system protein H [Euryarchaeota archaeon]RUA00583.1 MAG: glycine cleavage system protein GcvH [Candidatus Poseidoniales archaeon]
MSDIPEDLRYTEEHEWVRLEGDEVVVGITDHAQDALTGIVYVELPEVGASVSAGEVFGSVESVKSVSEIFAPLSGELSAVNEALDDAPELINDDPYGTGWIVRMRLEDNGVLGDLLDAAGYRALLGE